MKLRTKFLILSSGIIVFPLLVVTLTVMFNFMRRGRETPDHSQVEKWLITGEQEGDFLDEAMQYFISERPQGLEVLIIDSHNQVVKSNFSGFTPPANGSREVLFAYLRDYAGDFHFIINPYTGPDGSINLVFFKIPRLNNLSELIYQRIIFALQILLVLLLIAGIIAIIFIRSFNKSVIILKDATKKIAGGDLNFVIPIRGKDELADLTRSFDSMRLALKEEYARKARFLMGVSHDLKTPLALIEGYVEAIQDGHAEDPAKLHHFLNIVQDKSKLLESRISDLIEYVKLSTGEWKMIHRDVALGDFLKQIAIHYQRDAHLLKRNFSYVIELPREHMVRMDETLIQRVIENLIGNALQYTSENDRITLRAFQAGCELKIILSDTGRGISAEEREMIFEPFYRGSQSRQQQGFGLGLSTARSIIQAHNWQISVQSRPGEGTDFVIKIPNLCS